MSNEHAPTGGEGVSTTRRLSASGNRAGTGDELDALLEALADGRRRCVLAYFEEREEDVASLSDLVDHVAATGEWAAEEDGESAERRERVETSLHHAHLPKLADAGIVDFDARSGYVRYRGGPVVADWLALARRHESDEPGQ